MALTNKQRQFGARGILTTPLAKDEKTFSLAWLASCRTLVALKKWDQYHLGYHRDLESCGTAEGVLGQQSAI